MKLTVSFRVFMRMFTICQISFAVLLVTIVTMGCADPAPSQGHRHAAKHPIHLPSGAQLVKNVAYGADSAQVFDVYIPYNVHNAPVIFMVHGGGWQRGSKSAYDVVQNKIDYFLPKGYIFISTEYRKLPQPGVTVMTEAEDVSRALAFAQQHVKEWGGSPLHFVLMGHSAGAHLVVLISSVPRIWQSVGVKSWLGTVGLDSAVYNVVEVMDRRHRPLYDRVFGSNSSFWEEVSPTLRLRDAPPPMELVCSSLRRHSCAAASAYANKADSLGGHVNVLPVTLTHGHINLKLGIAQPYTQKVNNFIHSLVSN
jgi:acetyl esterase/lipase